MEILKQYVREGVDFANTALGEGEAALSEIPDAAVQTTLTQAMDFVRQIVVEGNAALSSGAYEDAWPHAAEMVRLSRLDAWPLATQSVRETGWVGQVVVKVTDQGRESHPGGSGDGLDSPQPGGRSYRC